MNLHDALLAKNILGGGGVPQSQIDEIATAIGIETPSDVETILNELDSIIADANETTGESDNSVIDATDRLIDGYRVVENLNVIENGTYMPDDGKAFGVVDVNVPNPSTGSINITENGTYDVTEKASAVVNVPSSGGGGEITSGVKFIDYDGTVIESWDSASVASKTELPTNPTHTGLVAQGWNWSLANIKSYITEYPKAIVAVGQMYETASGLTEIDITVTKVTGLTVTCKMSGKKKWGDGTNDSLTSHTYTDYGDYTITCDGTSIPSGTTTKSGMFEATSSNNNRYWCTAIRIGKKVTTINAYAFYLGESLASVTIPRSVTSIKNGPFGQNRSLLSITIPDSVTLIDGSTCSGCPSLASVSIPYGVTSIGNDAFRECSAITSIAIPDSVTSMGTSAFYYCRSLANVAYGSVKVNNYEFEGCTSLNTISFGSMTEIGSRAFYSCQSIASIIIPNSVTSIKESAFYSCYSLTRYDFSSATSVPTLSNTNAFSNINGICKIIVPDALYDTWIAATNWSTYADYIYKVSEVA